METMQNSKRGPNYTILVAFIVYLVLIGALAYSGQPHIRSDDTMATYEVSSVYLDKVTHTMRSGYHVNFFLKDSTGMVNSITVCADTDEQASHLIALYTGKTIETYPAYMAPSVFLHYDNMQIKLIS